MLYLVRGKTSSKEQVLLIEADSTEAAEAIGWKRGLFVVSVTEKEACALTPSWVMPMLRRAWEFAPSTALKCFGRPVSTSQSAALLALGVITALLNLHTKFWI
jgi:hypothetical protein